ncbi:MAG: riboflavin transporter, partial [Pseudomonadota bacterium]
MAPGFLRQPHLDPRRPKLDPRTMSDNLRGILAMLAATLAFTSGDAIIKLTGKVVPVGQMLFIRGLFVMALLAVAIWATGALSRWQPEYTFLTVVRSFAEIVSTVFFFLGLMTIAFAEASAIGQTAPLLVTAGAALFLGEKVGWRRWVATLIGFIGVLFIVRPGGDTVSWGAVLIRISTRGVAFRDRLTRPMPP